MRRKFPLLSGQNYTGKSKNHGFFARAKEHLLLCLLRRGGEELSGKERNPANF